MPLIDVKLYQDRLDERTRAELIGRLTDAAAAVLGDEVREHTWVVLTGVPRQSWGIAGEPGA
ncbi:4-oxalocrotonate tautomerase family protein [Streptomyces sp. NPDC048257]|uniref:tautomerase family protein n=1 Tax=Streptomyces sp. NPDC048257 TaxID=3365526 RepID=UPI0037111CC5